MRLQQILALTLVLGLATAASAQQGRATGTVKEVGGKPIKGATVTAINPDASPGKIASATDDKGRWAMIGLKTGTWRFVAEAPGFVTVEASIPVRVSSSAPLGFMLVRDPGPIPNALDRNIQQEILDASTLRDQGRLDQALAAYQDIRSRNPKLSSLNLVIADVYRRKAALETDPAAKQALLRQALDTYDLLLKSDADNRRALAEREAVRAAADFRQ